MARTKITQNINKDDGLLDLPKVKVPHSTWENKWSNYLTCNIGEIVPVYVDEVLPSEKRKVTLGMISHMTTPYAPIFNAQYTEFRSFYVPYRLAADLLAGYKTRKSPFVKVFGEDNASSSASIIVPLEQQKLPDMGSDAVANFAGATFRPFGGLADSLDMGFNSSVHKALYTKEMNFLSMASYELIYQKAYRNQNRESATESNLYRFLFDAYNRSSGNIAYDDHFHIAQREKDYFTGASPFTQKSTNPVSVGLNGKALIRADVDANAGSNTVADLVDTDAGIEFNNFSRTSGTLQAGDTATFGPRASGTTLSSLYADLTSATGVNIEQLRLMIKTQELLEKDMLYGNDMASSLNAHFGTAPISLVLEEPLELKKVTITSRMQAIFQSSSTSGEDTILGTIGANATTESGEVEIVPYTEFKEHGYLIICAVHKAQNSYDSTLYKPKHIFKKSRFDYYTPELNDLGYQKIAGREFYASANGFDTAVAFNEAYSEYRFKFNRVHGMFEPTRSGALDYWTLSCASYTDIQSLYKQSKTELDKAISVTSSVAPQFFDAYGFIEVVSKPMSLHSIPGMDGVI